MTPFDRPVASRPRFRSMSLVRQPRWLWTLAAVVLVLDVALTVVGLRLGLVETNPVATVAVAVLGTYGGLIALKLFAVVVALLGRAVLPAAYRAIAPLALAVPWTFAVVVNAVVIARTL